MLLKEQIELNKNDITGSRTKNRLTVQISYAMQLIMEYYTMDYVILMDYIEDVVIIENPVQPTGMHLYQIKTKSADKQYSLNTVIKDEWFQKLYKNALKYKGNVQEATVVCNTDVIEKQNNVFSNARNNLGNMKQNLNIQKIVKAISNDLNIPQSEVDLSHFFFVRSSLSTKGHKDEVEHQFESFLLKQDSKLQVMTARAIFKTIYDDLDKKFNWELDENCADIDEIFKMKGIVSEDINNSISTGLAIQLPDVNSLFNLFKITSIKEIREYMQRYSIIKMDMFPKKNSLVYTRKNIVFFIEESIENGIEEFSDLLMTVYEKCKDRGCIPIAYSEEYYLKLLIMLLIYKYCYGGEFN